MEALDAMFAALNAPVRRAVDDGRVADALDTAPFQVLKARPQGDVTARILDASKGIVRFVASDPTLDGYNEIVSVRGWSFADFDRNPVVLDSHTYTGISNVVGKVVRHEVTGNQLVEDVQFAIDVASNALARLAYDMIAADYLKACSVGFRPTRLVSKYSGDDKDFQAAVLELGLDAATAAVVRVIYLEQRQMELSVCPIGANPNALAKAHQDGAVTDEALERIAVLKISQLTHLTKTGSASANPADDAAALVRRDREAWLRDWQALINH